MIDVGQTVGNYQVTAQLGEGGMGKVFLAEHPVIRSKVALKAIHPQFASNAEVVSRFVNEARVVNQIGHDHIVNITDFGNTPEGDFYFIMEYLQGAMLSDLIGREPFLPLRAANIAAQIADALAASHERGVIHRDLKPENILLITREATPDFVKVFDFGLAKLTHPDYQTGHHTGAGIVMGTPYYMSPEQCEARAEVDHRADIYALGVILFEMLTGRVPFQGSGYGDVMVKHINLPPPTARSLVPDLPLEIDAIVNRALAKNPGDRFQTMTDFRLALLDYRGELAKTPVPIAVAPEAEAVDLPPPRRQVSSEISSEISLGEGAGELDDDLDLRPKRSRGRLVVAGVAVAAAMGLALTNVGLHRRAAQVLAAAAASAAPTLAKRTPATVRVNFSSDPDGATVSRSDGTVLGTTPLSTEVAYGDTPVEYVVHKDGYVPKVTSIVPNLPSPIFALLQKIDPPALVDSSHPTEAAPAAEERPAPQARPAHSHHSHHASSTAQPSASNVDGDDVMAPSTW